MTEPNRHQRAHTPPTLCGMPLRPRSLFGEKNSFALQLGGSQFSVVIYWSEGVHDGWQWGLEYGPALVGTDAQGSGPFETAQEAADHLATQLRPLLSALCDVITPF